MTTAPPVRGDPERDPDEPGDAEPQHAEEHPGADGACGGLASERRPAARIEPERRKQRDLGEDPVHVEEPLVALGLVDELGAEGPVDVDGRETEVVRHRGGKEQERAGDESCGDDDREDCSQNASPGRASGLGPGSGSARRSSTGAANG